MDGFKIFFELIGCLIFMIGWTSNYCNTKNNISLSNYTISNETLSNYTISNETLSNDYMGVDLEYSR